ncbi:DNA mismatch repair protein MutL family protein [Cordyceps fumosorosea ARSEF 2679]|uniref:DNA mismatch repair protein PMS1 n=1 Tax=Cordyceps fumosorosea (strain ARSEF 2679) TaxID=1081104 RepID=A0A162LDH4_CORFA|nr:DNA mismatch repair protein MutL family protein [Cordyceps fumosorosea ARSEF 2679]OAA69064.1 DNA mismatch repair protein MutL family protein [Cordyceps fumosorosea ARSEF 2679]
MATIKQIDGRSIHQIQSGQVIVDLCSVVKELVENSVDAGATTIDVRFKNQGLDSIEIQDNGSGIAPANYDSVALKHHTSKLSTYSDIASLHTFGFRGEALASLCALSTVTITTCLAQDAPKGTKLTFEASGKLKSTSIVAAQRGTTVAVEQLFHNLPVRRRELERNIKREWHKVIALLNQYACILTQLKFSVSQQPTKGKRILLFSTKGNQTTKDNIINIFGAKTMTALVALDLKLEVVPTTSTSQLTTAEASASKEIRVLGHVSRPVHGEGRQTPDRQMFFVNGRPCGLPQFAKTFNEVYKSYNYSQSPFIFADIRLDTNMYDVNVSPDKRSILLHDQNHLLESLRSALAELFDQHDYTVPVAQAFPTLGRSASKSTTPADPSPASTPMPLSKQQKRPEKLEHAPHEATAAIPFDEDESPRQSRSVSPDISLDRPIPAIQPMRLVNDTPRTRTPRSLKRDITETISVTIGDSPRKNIIISPSKRRKGESIASEDDDDEGMLSDDQDARQTASPQRQRGEPLQSQCSQENEDRHELEFESRVTSQLELEEEKDEAEQLSKEDGKASAPSDAEDESSEGDLAEAETANDDEESDDNPEQELPVADSKRTTLPQPTARRKDSTLTLIHGLRMSPELLRTHTSSYKTNALKTSTASANVDSVQDISAVDAESRLQLIISKGDFGRMRVVGQFNLGFIIAVRPRDPNNAAADGDDDGDGDELFIIDQHASDEKYNFERLQRDTVVQSQRLVRPKTLDLTALEEEVVMENLAAVEANGFQILVDASGDSPVGARCALTALPLSRETAFGLEDLEELIALLSDHAPCSSGGGDAQIPRPAKVRKMFAMRACRSSVMIGKALTGGQMYGLVRHMGELDKPWNCPHGRPTMRHLCRLRAWDEQCWKGDVVPTSSARWQSFLQEED